MLTAGRRSLAGAVIALVVLVAGAVPAAAAQSPFVPVPGEPIWLPPSDDPTAASDDRVVATNEGWGLLDQDVTYDDWEARLREDPGNAHMQLLALSDPLEPSTSGLAAARSSIAAIPPVVQAAYRNAARRAPQIVSGCALDWAVLAGIGRVESRHGLFTGDDAVIDARGNVADPIIGPPLNGASGFSAIPDSDDGRWDGDAVWDRAVGLMQFIPSSWALFGQDGNGDGRRNPHNVFDATAAAVDHLCRSDPGNLFDEERLERALYAYNRSNAYVDEVRRWIEVYREADPVGSTTAMLTFVDGAPRNPFSGALTDVAFGDVADDTGRRGAGNGRSGAGPAPVGSATGPATTPEPGTAPPGSATPAALDPAPSPQPAPAPSTTPDPEPAPEPPPASEPAPDPTPAPDPEPEPAPEPDPETDPEPSPSPEPSPASEPAPDPSPEPDPEPSPAAEPTLAPDPDPDPDPAPAPDPEPAPEPPPDPEPEPAPDPEPAPEPPPDPEPEPAPDPEPAPEPPPDPEPEPAPAPDPAPEAEPQPEPDPSAGP